MWRKKKKGVVSVETAVVMSVYLLILGTVIELGIDLYSSAVEQAGSFESISDTEKLCKIGRIV